ncbi:hypothetical protein [Chryseobacterium sp. ISL-6]|uniref:hypothetical protein n=1 Tax=Chryseobacterium sp. ISL-6 TaxID=2819143 RepID=UPI001BE8BB44|nr:hypothetical protein [Chryseobacterium sp. ISL-6]MBT2622442.1 hypothetical protein [Chryseobacterium sp. ISL-6]
MKNKFFLWLSLLITLSVGLQSCRNEDLVKAETNPKRNNSDFFKHPSSIQSKSSVDYINILEAYNRETDFLSKMPDQNGMPIWDKMYEVVTENAVGLMIPLSDDNETMSSILFATLDGKDVVTAVKDYDNALLEDIVYDQRISVENREKLFLTFMHMDNRTFGNEHFIGIPKDLFIGKKSDDEYGIMWMRNFAPSTKVTIQQEGKLMIIETCFIALHCTHHGEGICDAESGCTDCGTTYCTYEVIGTVDDPFPSTPGGGGGGGGGGGCFGCGGGGTPGPNVPSNPCGSNFNKAFYRLPAGCGGGTIPGLNDPCQKISNLYSNSKFKEKVAAIDKPEVFNYDHEMGYAAGYPVNTTVTGTQYPPMENVLGTHNVTLPSGDQYFGFIHSHNNESDGGHPIKIFSPGDLSTFLTSCVANADGHGNIADAYAMVITSEGNYILQFTGLSSSFGIGPNTIKFWKTWYEREMGKLVLEDEITQANVEKVFLMFLQEKVKIDGIELYKVEKITGKAKKLSLDQNNNVLPIPCP